MAEKEGVTQLHIDNFPIWIKKAMKEWAAKQVPPSNLTRVTISLCKKWVESGCTTPKIGDTTETDNKRELEKQRKIEELQRQQVTSQPITSSAISFVLLSQANSEGIVAPGPEQIEETLDLLANKVFAILVKENNGYVLTLSPAAARQRIAALESLILGDVQ